MSDTSVPTVAEKIIKVNKVKYPSISIWDRYPKPKERLAIVNQEDFPEGEILESLGIAESPLAYSFGITDMNEISKRQKILKFLIDRPKLRKWIGGQLTESPLPESRFSSPDNGEMNRFQKYFNPKKEHNPFWGIMAGFLSYCEEEPLPEELKKFQEMLKKNLGLEEAEKQMGRIIGDRIQNVATIEGIVTLHYFSESVSGSGNNREWKIGFLNISGGKKENRVFGYRKYTASLLDVETRNLGNSLFDKAFFKDFRNKLEKTRALQDSLVEEIDQNLEADLISGIQRIFESIRFRNSAWASGQIKARFAYGDKGLSIRIFSCQPYVEDNKYSDFQAKSYEGFSSKEKIAWIEAARKKFEEEAYQTDLLTEKGKMLVAIEEQSPRFFHRWHYVPSARTDMRHKWFAVSNFYRTVFKETYDALNAHREFFFSNLRTLRYISGIADRLVEMSQALNAPICWPEFVLDGEHVVAFESLIPIHLLHRLDKYEQVVPIQNMPVLNGQIIGLTGSHEGGKTVTSSAISEAIFLAQSGLPLLGKGFRLNLKKIVGVVFLTRGEGSMARIMIEKVKNFLETARDAKPEEVVVILDELGEGTQEISGAALGWDLLKALKKKGVSVIFNTQITGLAERAQNELGAQCMRFSSDHKIEVGVGDGDMPGLRRKTGLDTALNRFN